MKAQPRMTDPYVLGPHDTPQEIRGRILETIREVADAEIGLFYSLAESEGRALISEWQAAGHPVGSRAMRVLVDRPTLLPPSVVARFRRPPPRQQQTFLETSAFVDWSVYRDTEFYRNIHDAFGLGDQIRLLVYDRARFVGWVGAYRLVERPRFTRNDRRQLGPYVEGILAAMIEADRRAAMLLSRPGALLLREDGERDFASPGIAAWLESSTHFADLREMVLSARPQVEQAGGWTGVLHRLEVRIVRMEGIGGTRFLVQLTPATPLQSLGDRSLSPVQRHVATLAASGATIPEIAHTLDRAPETIRTHLKEAYTRLGINTRLELARVLDPSVHG